MRASKLQKVHRHAKQDECMRRKFIKSIDLMTSFEELVYVLVRLIQASGWLVLLNC